MATLPSADERILSVGELARAGATVDEAVMALTTQDVRDACDVFAPVHEASGGVDGRVSIEVDPRLAHDTAATVAQALELAAAVGRPDVMGTRKSLTLSEGMVGMLEGVFINVKNRSSTISAVWRISASTCAITSR